MITYFAYSRRNDLFDRLQDKLGAVTSIRPQTAPPITRDAIDALSARLPGGDDAVLFVDDLLFPKEANRLVDFDTLLLGLGPRRPIVVLLTEDPDVVSGAYRDGADLVKEELFEPETLKGEIESIQGKRTVVPRRVRVMDRLKRIPLLLLSFISGIMLGLIPHLLTEMRVTDNRFAKLALRDLGHVASQDSVIHKLSIKNDGLFSVTGLEVAWDNGVEGEQKTFYVLPRLPRKEAHPVRAGRHVDDFEDGRDSLRLALVLDGKIVGGHDFILTPSSEGNQPPTPAHEDSLRDRPGG